MPNVEQTVFGAPCWVDLTNVDLEGTKPFYNALFGWTFTNTGPEFGNYNIISVGEDVVGGAMQYNPEFMGPEPINAWSLFFATADMDASFKTASDKGGTAQVQHQVGDQGTMGTAIDPTGVGYGLWQPDRRQGYDRWGEHGFPGWFELHTRDFDSASRYYASVLGAELGTDESTQGMRYATLNIDGDAKAGIFDITGMLPDEAPTAWYIYFIVDDTDVAVATAREHGGAVIMDPEDSPYGRMATLQDPAGAVFNLISGD